MTKANWRLVIRDVRIGQPSFLGTGAAIMALRSSLTIRLPHAIFQSCGPRRKQRLLPQRFFAELDLIDGILVPGYPIRLEVVAPACSLLSPN